MDDFGNDLCFYFMYLKENNFSPIGFSWTGYVYFTAPEYLSSHFRWE